MAQTQRNIRQDKIEPAFSSLFPPPSCSHIHLSPSFTFQLSSLTSPTLPSSRPSPFATSTISSSLFTLAFSFRNFSLSPFPNHSSLFSLLSLPLPFNASLPFAPTSSILSAQHSTFFFFFTSAFISLSFCVSPFSFLPLQSRASFSTSLYIQKEN